MTMVTFSSSFSFQSRSITPELVSSSKFPVGSSVSITFGLLNSALAMATRCCSPPLSSPGL